MPKIKSPLLEALCRYGVAAAVASTVSILLARLDWRLDLLSHFRLQLVGLLLLFLLPLILMRRWKSMAIIALCLAPHLWSLSIHYLPVLRDRRPTEGPPLSLLSFNVLSENRDYQAVRQLVVREDPDVLFLTEINSLWRDEMRSLLARYPYTATRTSEDNFGMLLYSKFPITQREFIIDSTIRAPLLVARLAWDDQELTFFGLHPQTPISAQGARSRNATFALVARLSQERSPLLIAGDFNCSTYSPHFQDFSRGLKDSASGRGNVMTWHRLSPLLGIPIDHILYGDSLVCTSMRIGPKCGSDHSAVLASFRKAK